MSEQIRCPQRHNLPFAEVMRLIREDVTEEDELAVISIKPGFFPVAPEGVEVQRQVEELMPIMGLRTICTSCRNLSIEDIYLLYEDVLVEDPQPSDRLQALRKDLIEYLSSGLIFSYLAAGVHACQQASSIKKVLREGQALMEYPEDNVRNVVHTSDLDEVELNIQIYFGAADGRI
jgi:nucleoside diphosphate kinase